jgi:pimeloyl-ACP methyl ester carboxylesterase
MSDAISNATGDALPYTPRRRAHSRHVPIRGLDYHLLQWGEPQPGQPLLLLMHGWMDVGASFQFMVDQLADAADGPRCIVAPDWRGFGRTVCPPSVDAYWFPDYVGDLDALVDALSPEAPVDLLGHSMGGNVVMSYAGVRPQRIRRLVNLEGFGLPDADPQQAPQRLADWLDELKTPQRLKPYASRAQVAQRLRANNPRLAADHALWLADHWAQPDADGQWHLQADAAHKRINPVPYRAADVVATWSRISAPLLWVQGDSSTPERHWQGRYSVAEFHQRLDQVPHVRREVLGQAGHMLHHDQPQALAALLADFLG